jgi:3-hydroxypropanoate dehydrogenase
MLDPAALDTLFRQARTYTAWLPQPVSEDTLRALYDLLKWGPTSANCTPARIVFVQSAAAKARLVPCMDAGNREKTRTAPVTAIVGMDMRFYEELPRLYHDPGARSWFEGKPDLAEAALRNSSLQGAYLIMAARALGLDCGPMSGFDAGAINAAFFADGRVKVNFVCNLGHGDPSVPRPRNPRLPFEDACRIE